MKKLANMIVLFYLASSVHAQSIERKVIASGGRSFINGNSRIDFTIGEPFSSTVSMAGNSITQGFHQPALMLARLADPSDTSQTLPDENLNAKMISGIDLTVFPNPAVDFINLKLNGAIDEPITISVANFQGQIVAQQTMEGETTQVDFSGFVAGTYIVIVKNNKGDLSNSYKVIKQ